MRELLPIYFNKRRYNNFSIVRILTSEMERDLSRNIQCYKCSGKDICGTFFSLNFNNHTEYLSPPGNELFYSCSVSVFNY